MPEISDIFGEERLSYAEFRERAERAGVLFGDVEAARTEARAAFDRQLSDVRRSAALERELDRAKVKNRSIVSKIIDMEKVTVDESGVGGIAEQLDLLRRTDPYLFETENPPSPAPEGSTARFSSGLRHTESPADPDSMSDAEYYRAVKKL